MSATLLRALRDLTRASTPILNEQAWLSRILYNVCMDMYRHRRRFAKPTSHEEGEPPEDESNAACQDSTPSPEEEFLSREQSLEVQHCIQALPCKLRVPFLMRFQQEMSYPDIADALKLTSCNVRKRIQLASEQLRATHAKRARP